MRNYKIEAKKGGPCTDICVITNDLLLARFIELELTEAGYSVCSGENAKDARLYIYDLDFASDTSGADIGFSYNEAKRAEVNTFLQRPIDAAALVNAVSGMLKGHTAAMESAIEVCTKTRKARTDKGEVRLSAKELALLVELCRVPLLSREDGAKIFGEAESNVVDVYMHYLRRKLAKVYGGETVISMRSKGYALAEALKINFT